MAELDALKEFKDGLELLRNSYAKKALEHFTKASELDKTNPFYMSYMGLALAAGEQKWDEAEEICQAALKRKRTQAELYLNLSEVYRLQGKRQDAIETLSTGLTLTKRDARLAHALRKLGVRRPPVLSFLDRGHFLNLQLGRLRYKMMKSLGKEI